MFEEVPRDRRGVARLLPVRRVVLGPFVVGGGLLLAAVGGSVAVAATVITASTIGATDVPPRPSHSATAGPHQAPAAKRSQVPYPTASPSAGRQLPAPRQSGPAAQAGTAPATAGSPAPSQGRPISGPARAGAAPRSSAATSPVPSASPSSTGSEPAGNAVVYISGYDKATGRIEYQFATVQPGTGGNDLYQVSGTDTFSARPADAITITSGGALCPPAGSSCTLDQLISAADFGFFAEVAIDAGGQLRSVVEVGSQSTAAKLAPAPSSSAPPSAGRPQPSLTNPPPASPSPAATS